MITSRRTLIIALLIPIAALAALTAYKKYVLSFGQEIVLPISGYDPRDLLSGHYLIYQVEYGVGSICGGGAGPQTGFVCLSPKLFSYTAPNGCLKVIRGLCNNGRFEAGIEKYYIPEDKAKALEEKVRSKSASIVLSVTTDGQAQVKDLLIDGQPWKDQ